MVILTLGLWFVPWVALALAALYSFFHGGRYYELLALGLLLDVFYESVINLGMLSLPLYTIVSGVVFLTTSYVKKQMNIYA